jgi:hypothetical protein
MGSYACYSSNFSTRVQDKHSIIFQDYKPIGNTKWDFLYKFFIGSEHIIIYHGFRVYLTMIVQYKLQHDDEMTSKDDKSIGLICYTCIR